MNTTKSNHRSHKKRAPPGRGGGAAAATSKKKGRLASSTVANDPYLPTSLRPAVKDSAGGGSSAADDDDMAGHKLELQRLLYAMEQTSSTASSASNSYTSGALVNRADLLQALWDKVRPNLVATNQSSDEIKQVEQRVAAARQTALQQAAAAASSSNDNSQAAAADAAVRRVFVVAPTAADKGGPDEEEEEQEEEKDDEVPPPAAAASSARQPQQQPTSTTRPTATAVQDLQKAQREQVEEAIHQMASQLKQETSRIHSTLQDQNEGLLEDMQVAAEKNVDDVTAVAQDVQDHVQAGWSRTAATWTVFFTICAAFVFGLMTIQLVPKRAGSCLFFCPKSPDPNEFCRILPSGKKECIVQDAQEQDDDEEDDIYHEAAFGEGSHHDQHSPPETLEEDQQSHEEEEYEVGMQGDAVPPPQYDIQIPSDEEMRQKVLEEVEQTRSGNTATPREDDDHVEEPEQPTMPPTEIQDEDDEEEHYEEEEYVEGGYEEEEDDDDEEDEDEPPAPSSVKEMPAMPPSLSPSSGEQEESFPGIFNSESLVKDPPVTATATASHPAASSTTEETPKQEQQQQRQEQKQQAEEQHQQQQQGAPPTPVVPIYRGKPFSATDVRRAATAGDVLQLSQMLHTKPDWVDAQDGNGWNALHLATRKGLLNVVQFLLQQAGANAAMKTRAGKTALDIAQERLGADHEVTQLLLLQLDSQQQQQERQQQEQKQQDVSYSTADVATAVVRGDLPLLHQILHHHPTWVDYQDENGWAAIHLAGRAGNAPAVDYLLHQARCNVQLETKTGHTALSLAYERHGPDHAVTQLLLQETKDSGGGDVPLYQGKPFTASQIQAAAQSGNVALLSELLQLKPEWVNAGDQNGWTALHQGARAGHVHVVQHLLAADYDCNVHQATKTGHTALNIAQRVHGDDHEVVKLLLLAAARDE